MADRLLYHTRRLELPDGKGWIEIHGAFNPFELEPIQLRMIGMLADWFTQFDESFPKPKADSLVSAVYPVSPG